MVESVMPRAESQYKRGLKSVVDSRNSNPLEAQGEGHGVFFGPSESTLVQTCLCLTPLRVYGTDHNVYAR